MSRQVKFFLFVLIAPIFMFASCAKNSTPSTAGDNSTLNSTDTTNPDTSSLDLPGGGANASGSSMLPTVYFGYNEYTLSSEGRDKLKGALSSIKQSKGKITVEGHCDERGSSEYNLALGEKRAQTVKSYLQKLGVSSDKISTISFGKERPADYGHNEDAWAKNRRGEMVSSQ